MMKGSFSQGKISPILHKKTINETMPNFVKKKKMKAQIDLLTCPRSHGDKNVIQTQVSALFFIIPGKANGYHFPFNTG